AFALAAGEIEVVRSSIIGSIVGNLLLVMGMALLVGGLRHGVQTFDAKVAGLDATLLVLAVISLFIPAVFVATSHSGTSPGAGPRTEESVVIAIALLILYVLNVIYRLKNPSATHAESEGLGAPPWNGLTAAIVLGVAATLLAVLSEQLVGAIDPFVASF